MKIAIIGAGISGNLAAYHLQDQHEITVFEADSRIGGHSNTIDVKVAGRNYAVDTGFIVYNDCTYPHFVKLLDELQVLSQTSEMSFSVRCEVSGLEYNGASLNTLFAQRRNLVRPQFHRMVFRLTALRLTATPARQKQEGPLYEIRFFGFSTSPGRHSHANLAGWPGKAARDHPPGKIAAG